MTSVILPGDTEVAGIKLLFASPRAAGPGVASYFATENSPMPTKAIHAKTDNDATLVRFVAFVSREDRATML